MNTVTVTPADWWVTAGQSCDAVRDGLDRARVAPDLLTTLAELERARRETTAQRGDPLAHAEEPVAAAGQPYVGAAVGRSVQDEDGHLVLPVGKADLGLGTGGVLVDVGQGFLDDAVDGGLDEGCDRPLGALHREVDEHPDSARLLDEDLQLLQAGPVLVAVAQH